MPVTFPRKSSDFLKVGVAAAARGDIDAVREILKARPKWIHRIGSHGRTMLWEAAHKGRLAMVKYLLRRKADINACGTHYTPYFVEISCYCIARHKKHDDVADFLLSKGAVLNIHTAAFLGDLAGVRGFLKRRRKSLDEGHPQYIMGEKTKGGRPYVLAAAPWATPLCYALRGGDLETIEYLIQRRAKIKGHEKFLFIAAQQNYDRVKLLLENGADPALLPEVKRDEGQLYELATLYGATACSDSNSEELVYLCRGDRGGNPTEARRLLRLGADVNFRDSKGKTALHRAAKSGFVETLQILLDAGAMTDVSDNNGETALFDAVRSTIKNLENRKAAIRILIKHGAGLEHLNSKRQTVKDVLKVDRRLEEKEISRLLRRR